MAKCLELKNLKPNLVENRTFICAAETVSNDQELVQSEQQSNLKNPGCWITLFKAQKFTLLRKTRL